MYATVLGFFFFFLKKKLRLVTAWDATYQQWREIPTHIYVTPSPRQGLRERAGADTALANQHISQPVAQGDVSRSVSATGVSLKLSRPCQTERHSIRHTLYRPAIICAIDTEQPPEGSTRSMLEPEKPLVYAALQRVTAAEISLAQLQEQKGLLQWCIGFA